MGKVYFTCLNATPAACSFGWWLMLICSERKVPLVGCWWLVCCEKKY
jgi:hypothetical protein